MAGFKESLRTVESNLKEKYYKDSLFGSKVFNGLEDELNTLIKPEIDNSTDAKLNNDRYNNSLSIIASLNVYLKEINLEKLRIQKVYDKSISKFDSLQSKLNTFLNDQALSFSATFTDRYVREAMSISKNSQKLISVNKILSYFFSKP